MTAAIASALANARRIRGLTPLSADMPLDRAYRVQADAFAQRGAALAGWKIGLTGEGIRIALGARDPAAGRLAREDILRGPSIAGLGGGDYYVEGELVFQIGRTLLPQAAPFTQRAVAEAIGGLHAGIELVASRFETDDLPLGLLVADNVMADRLLVGDKVADGWDDRFAAMPATLEGPGPHHAQGSTAAVMGNPLAAVTWLANWLSAQGLALEEGHLVSSGTCTGVTLVMPGDRVAFDLGGLGSATLEFTAGS